MELMPAATTTKLKELLICAACLIRWFFIKLNLAPGKHSVWKFVDFTCLTLESPINKAFGISENNN